MGDGKLGEFGVGNQSRAPAGGAPLGGGIELGKAVAAETWHGGRVAGFVGRGEGLTHVCDVW